MCWSTGLGACVVYSTWVVVSVLKGLSCVILPSPGSLLSFHILHEGGGHGYWLSSPMTWLSSPMTLATHLDTASKGILALWHREACLNFDSALLFY
jgi:hypothetical protein